MLTLYSCRGGSGYFEQIHAVLQAQGIWLETWTERQTETETGTCSNQLQYVVFRARRRLQEAKCDVWGRAKRGEKARTPSCCRAKAEQELRNRYDDCDYDCDRDCNLRQQGVDWTVLDTKPSPREALLCREKLIGRATMLENRNRKKQTGKKE